MNIRSALKEQYDAAMIMLKQAIDECPDDLWVERKDAVPYWAVAYHTLYFTHLYLHPNVESFRPWKHHHEGYDRLNGIPADSTPYTREQMLEYWQLVGDMVKSAVDTMDLDAEKCGFPWYKMPKLDHQINNIRHLQHHIAILASRLRAANGTDVRWQKVH